METLEFIDCTPKPIEKETTRSLFALARVGMPTGPGPGLWAQHQVFFYIKEELYII